MDKKTIKQYKEFFLNSFHHEDDLIKEKSLTELIILEQTGKRLLMNINEIINNKEFDKFKLTEEDVYFDKHCIIDNLESVMKCIGYYNNQNVFFHLDMKNQLLTFKFSKN